MTSLLELDDEMLAIMLETMSYSQILKWCNSDPIFKRLCENEERLIGQLLQRKAQEEVIASVVLIDPFSPNLFFRLALFSENPHFKRVHIVIGISQETAREINNFDVSSIDPREASKVWDIDIMFAGKGFIMLGRDGTAEIYHEGESIFIDISADFLKTIFSVALNLERNGIFENEGFAEILVDLSSELQIYR